MAQSRRAFHAWGRDIALAVVGAALGIVVVGLIGGRFDPPPQAPAPQKAEATAGTAERDRVVVRGLPPPKTPRFAAPDMPSSETPRFAAPDVPPPEPQVSHLPPVAPTPPALPTWQQFAVSPPAVGDRPMIAVIIDDLGLDRNRSARTVALPGPLTLSYLTYAIGLRGQTAEARRHGHELLVHVPMEPDSANAYAGPNAIGMGLPPDELERRLRWALGRFEGYVGINNHMGSRFTADAEGMSLVLAEIGRRGLLFVDSRTSPRSVARSVAQHLAVPFAERNVFLDDDPSADAVRRQLAELERIALKQGYAVAIGHPRDATLAALEQWLPGLAAHGFVLVPVSAIVRRRLEAG